MKDHQGLTEPLRVVEVDAEEAQAPLAGLMRYNMRTDQQMAAWQQALQTLGLMGLSAAAAFNYVPPARAYAESAHPLVPLKDPIRSIVGTCVPCASILVISTEEFLKWLKAQRLPPELRDLLTLAEAAKTRGIKYVTITVGSLISSAVLTGTYLAYPNDDPLWQTALLTTVILITNTMLHFLPFQLMSQEKMYRLPVLPLEWAASKMIAACRSSERQQQLANLSAHKDSLAFLQSRLNNMWQQNVNQLIKEALDDPRFSWVYGRYLKKEAVDTLRKIMGVMDNYEITPSEALRLVFKLENRDETPETATSSTNKSVTCSRTTELFIEVMYVVAVITGISGYLANATNLSIKALDSKTGGIIISVLPNYALSVLLAFFARNFAKADIANAKALAKGELELPLMVQYYPLPYIVLHGFTLYCLGFSHAAAMGMVDLNFPSDLSDSELWHHFRQALVGITIGSIGYVSLKLLDSVYKTLMEKLTRFIGAADRKTLAIFMQRANHMGEHLTLLQPDVLRQMVADISDDGDAKRYFGVDKATLQQKTNELLSKEVLAEITDGACQFSCAFWQTARSSTTQSRRALPSTVGEEPPVPPKKNMCHIL